MFEYDIYLNGVGYMLARDSQGRPLSGGARGQASDPFNNYTSEQERWKRIAFKFAEGAGAELFKNDDRYRTAARVDTRSGKLLRGPLVHLCDEIEHTADKVLYTDTVGDYELGSGAGQMDGFAVRWTAPDTGQVQSVAILVKRDEESDYTGAGNFTVELWDSAGADGRPGAVLAGVGVGTAVVSMSPIVTPNEYLPMEDLWRNGEYFWLVCHLAYDNRADVANGTNYWLCVFNNLNAVPVYWGYQDNSTTGYRCEATGAPGAPGWQAPVQGDIPYHKVKLRTVIDGPVYNFALFRGADHVERLFAAVGCKVMYYDESDETWKNSKNDADFTDPVLQLCVFNSRLFAAQGTTSNMEEYDGTTETTNWTSAAVTAQCLALHDNMLWRGSAAEVEGSLTGLAAGWAGAAVTVGDPGTPVCALTSHGGKLFAAKPEGIFEIDYPDGYPGAGTPTANLLHDFRTERAQRPFCIDWHSALYFPGTGGILEYKNSVLSDIWSDRIEAETDPWFGYIENTAKYWSAVTGTTRGLIFIQSSPHCDQSTAQIWVYRKLALHPMMLEVHHGERIHGCLVQSLGGGRGRLWYGAGHEIKYMNWPVWCDNRAEDESSDYYDDTGFVVLPRVDEDRPEQLKDWHELRCTSENLGATAGGTLDVYWRTDPEGAWVELGTFDTSPLQPLPFPAGSVGYLLDLALVLRNPSNTTETCKIKELDLLYQPLPDTVQQYQLTIEAADELKLHRAGRDTRVASQIVTALTALLDETEPFAYQDEFGITHYVRAVGVSRHTVNIAEKAGQVSRQPEAQVVITLLKVSDSAPGELGDEGIEAP